MRQEQAIEKDENINELENKRGEQNKILVEKKMKMPG